MGGGFRPFFPAKFSVSTQFSFVQLQRGGTAIDGKHEFIRRAGAFSRQQYGLELGLQVQLRQEAAPAPRERS